MQLEFGYGNGVQTVELPQENLLGVLHAAPIEHERRGTDAVSWALAHPIGSAPLHQLARPGQRITIVTSDITRPLPSYQILPGVLDELYRAGVRPEDITVVLALGSHRRHTPEEVIRLVGRECYETVRCVDSDAADCIHLGDTAHGTPVDITRAVAEADFRICLGNIEFHYFAGYSGGRKSILPGICGKKTVQDNHARMVEILDHMPPIRENPISLEMIEAARKVGVNFVFNAVMNADNQVVRLVAGDLVEAWYEAVDTSSSMYEIPFTEPVDIAVSSACGYPRDVNWYQAQKAIDHADKIVKPGGTIIVCGECRDGYGNKVFEEWMKKKLPPEEVMREIRAHFVLGGHKAFAFAKVASEKKLVLVSSMNAEDTATLYGTKAASVQEAFDQAVAACPDASIAIMPEGGLTLPVHMNA